MAMTAEEWGIGIAGGVLVLGGIGYALDKAGILHIPLPGGKKATSSPSYPVAFLVADQEGEYLAKTTNPPVPTAELYYIGTDPFANRTQGQPASARYGAPTRAVLFTINGQSVQVPKLPVYTASSTQPPRVVLVGLAVAAYNQSPTLQSRLKGRVVQRLQGATRIETRQALQSFVTANPALLKLS